MKNYRYKVGTPEPKQTSNTPDYIIQQLEQEQLKKLYRGKTN